METNVEKTKSANKDLNATLLIFHLRQRNKTAHILIGAATVAATGNSSPCSLNAELYFCISNV